MPIIFVLDADIVIDTCSVAQASDALEDRTFVTIARVYEAMGLFEPQRLRGGKG